MFLPLLYLSLKLRVQQVDLSLTCEFLSRIKSLKSRSLGPPTCAVPFLSRGFTVRTSKCSLLAPRHFNWFYLFQDRAKIKLDCIKEISRAVADKSFAVNKVIAQAAEGKGISCPFQDLLSTITNVQHYLYKCIVSSSTSCRCCS